MLLCVESMKFLWCSYELFITFQGLVDMAPFPRLFGSFSSSSSRGCDGWDCGWLWSSIVWMGNTSCLHKKQRDTKSTSKSASAFERSQNQDHWELLDRVDSTFWLSWIAIKFITPLKFTQEIMQGCYPASYCSDYIRLIGDLVPIVFPDLSPSRVVLKTSCRLAHATFKLLHPNDSTWWRDGSFGWETFDLWLKRRAVEFYGKCQIKRSSQKVLEKWSSKND